MAPKATVGVSRESTEGSVVTYDTRGNASSRHRNKEGSGGCASVNRTTALRGSLVLSLIAAVAICSSLAYTSLKASEENVGIQTYQSIALSATAGAKAITQRKFEGSDAMVALLGDKFPDSTDWPFVVFDRYIAVSKKIASLSASGTLALIVLVDPTDASEFENHTKAMYEAQQRPEGTGYSDFGFGVWKADKNETKTYEDGRIQDITGETSWGGNHNKMAVLMMHNVPGAGSLNFNIYSESDRGVHIDSIYDCVEANMDNAESPSCTAVTDMIELKLKPGPAGAMFQPIYPLNNPTEVVGLVGTSIHWEDVLTNVVPDYVNGLTCVVTTDTSAYTFIIRHGKPELVGDGDLHDRAYTSYGESVILNEVATGALTAAVYTLTVYPTEEMFEAFATNSPTTVALGFAGVIAGVALLFFGYDYLVRGEARKRNEILEVKRRFVRFISHEIRTPLNTVCMGLELLQSELKVPLKKAAGAANKGGENNADEKDHSPTHVEQEDLSFWLNVSEETNENAHVAVEILNDLLNYDKLETGSMELEQEPVLIWDLIEKTVNQFGIQAVNRKIYLKLDMQRPYGGTIPDEETGPDSFDPYNIVGDRIRLSEVIRNVISNALKFTPEDGTIQVTASHIPNGLPLVEAATVEGEEGPLRERAGSILLSVKDTGVGLSKDQLSKLFQEGVQFDANRLQHGGGSGLGLNIAKGLVEQHAGLIYAESDGIGHGTTFKVELPLYSFMEEDLKKYVRMDSTSSATEPTEPPSSMEFSTDDNAEKRASSKPEPVHKRVLVAEDSASSRKMLIRLLERAGHVCVPAANGKQAVDAVRDDLDAIAADPDHIPIDTILMDYEMPLINGPSATKIIRRLGFKRTILGITGNVLSEDIEYFEQHGADEVMSKPVSLKEIQKYWKDHKEA